MTTANAIRDLRETLERLGKEATPGDLATAESVRTDTGVECPMCGGDGDLDAKAYTNFDNVAVGVQFFGVGNEHVVQEALWHAYRNNHAQILAALRVAEVADEVKTALEQAAIRFDSIDEYQRRNGPIPYFGGCAYDAAHEHINHVLKLLQSAKEPK